MERKTSESQFSRLIPMLSDSGLERLGNARVVVFGLGGVGGSCVEALVRGGIGSLVLADGDEVEISNLNRQVVARQSTLGMRKVDAALQLAHDINPLCAIELHDCFVAPSDTATLLDSIASNGRIDYIIDCIDTVGTKIELAAWAEKADVPYVSSAGTARKFDASRFEFANIYDTEVCPLCRVLRREARKRKINRMEMLYSQEEPYTGIAAEEEAPLGTLSYVPPVAGMLLAGRVLQAISFGSPE